MKKTYFACNSFLIALATQINDADSFRALLDQCEKPFSLPFSPDTLENFTERVNQILGTDELYTEQSCKSIILLKNDRGLVVKIINKDGAAQIDSYYSYPSNRPAGKELFKIGKTKFYSSRATMQKLADHVAGGHDSPGGSYSPGGHDSPGGTPRQKQIPPAKTISAVTQVFALKKAVAGIKRGESQLRASHAIAIVFCYLLGAVIVQTGFIWYFGEPVLTFMAFFFCGFLGLLLNFFTTECIFPVFIPRYRSKLRYGEEGQADNFFKISYLSNVALYMISIMFVPLTTMKIIEVLLGLIFTFYPMNYLVNTLFSMRRYVLKINAGKLPMNVRYYTNTMLPRFDNADMPPVSISLTVFTEENSVLFETMRHAMEALKDYMRKTGVKANLVVSDDGFFRYLKAFTDPGAAELYMKRYFEKDPTLSENELVILERIRFYRENGIAFVARPSQNRLGKFKKGSNLNYTNRLARAIAEGNTREELLADGGEFYGAYFEGDIVIGDFILVLDKDSGLDPGILYATVPEFLNDPKLAYTQHKTVSINANVNYFTRSMSVFLNTLYNTHLPNKTLQGLTVPLMGHNAFVRRSFIEESGGWAEDRVAEDFSKSLDAYRLGYHGKFIAYKGMDFTEYTCYTFAEETEKQFRYCYGLVEMIFKDFKKHIGHYLAKKPYDNPAYGRLKSFQIMDIFTYFLSYANLAGAIPIAIFIITGTYINILYGGIIINIVIYLLCPLFHSIIFRVMSRDKNVVISLFDHAIISFNYFGHSYSMLKGIITFAADRIRGRYDPFPATGVDYEGGNFFNGVRTIAYYYVKNFPFTIAAIVLAAKGITLLMSGNTSIEVIIPAVYLLSFLFPILLMTPQIFAPPIKRTKESGL